MLYIVLKLNEQYNIPRIDYMCAGKSSNRHRPICVAYTTKCDNVGIFNWSLINNILLKLIQNDKS